LIYKNSALGVVHSFEEIFAKEVDTTWLKIVPFQLSFKKQAFLNKLSKKILPSYLFEENILHRHIRFLLNKKLFRNPQRFSKSRLAAA